MQKEENTRKSAIERYQLLRLDYEQTLAYYHNLHEVRFKLLGFLPLVTGAGVALVTQETIHVPHQTKVALAFLGALTTLGLASYDQRNTHIYERLVCRARFLEHKMGFPALPEPASDLPPSQEGDTRITKKLKWKIRYRMWQLGQLFGSEEADSREREARACDGGGPFHARPPVHEFCGMRLAWHVQGLTVVYASCLAAWTFLGISANVADGWIITILTTVVFLIAYTLLRFVSSVLYKTTGRIKKRVAQRWARSVLLCGSSSEEGEGE